MDISGGHRWTRGTFCRQLQHSIRSSMGRRRRSWPGTARDFLPNWGPGLRSFPSTPPGGDREKLFFSQGDSISTAPGAAFFGKTRRLFNSIARFLLRRITRRVYRVVSEYWICEFIEYREKHLLKLAVLCFRPGFYQTPCIHPLPICHLLPRVTSVT